MKFTLSAVRLAFRSTSEQIGGCRTSSVQELLTISRRGVKSPHGNRRVSAVESWWKNRRQLTDIL